MRAMTVQPGQPDTVQVTERPEPPESEGTVLVEGLSVGICGTDVEIIRQGYGWPPPGSDRLVIGHESLGRVVSAPSDAPVTAGDLVMGVVRRPDPEPCPCCAAGEWDFCRNGRYTERGIKERDGYGAQLWRVAPQYAIRVDAAMGDRGVLVEPASVVAKAWEQTERIRARSCAPGNRVLITGAGPIGLLAALLGVQRGYEVHVLDRVTTGPKPGLVTDLGATYHHGDVADIGFEPDVVVECTGVGSLVFDIVEMTAPGAVVCLTGMSSGHRNIPTNLDAINKDLVLENVVVFGSVNAAARNYTQAVQALAQADQGWLDRLITRRVSLGSWNDALTKNETDVKVVVDLQH